MPNGFRHFVKRAFGKRVSQERVDELASDVAIYSAAFADDLVSSLKAEGIQLGHRSPCIRREAIAFFAVFAMGYLVDNPQRKALAFHLVSKLKEQFDPLDDVGREKFFFNSPDGKHYDGIKQINRLAETIDDRITFYDVQNRSGAPLKVIIRFAFAAAHVLYGPKLSGKSLDEIKRLLLDESGRVKRIEYPDERRDEFIAEWLSTAIEPIQKQFDDFFYVGEYHRIP
jgi:hypothetical protein